MKKNIFLLLACCLLSASCCSRQQVAVYMDESQPLEARVEDALSRMALEEKVGIP